MLDRITPFILTYNEEPNLERTLSKLTWAKQIIVVDSFSTDRTLEILARYPSVTVLKRKFDYLANQCNFGLENAPWSTDWILSMDADFVLTDELIEEIRRLEPTPDIAGYRTGFIYCIDGQKLRGSLYPPLITLFRRGAGRYEQVGHTHKVFVEGRVELLRGKILHDDRKPLKRWFRSQQYYLRLEAERLAQSRFGELKWTNRIRKLKVLAPFTVLGYCLVIRGLALEGRAGWVYTFQRVLAESLLSYYQLARFFRRTKSSATEGRR